MSSRFGAYCDSLAGDDPEKEVLCFAKQKLLNGKRIVVDGDGPASGSLACLVVRFALDFKSDVISGRVVLTQVEHHMRLILAADTGFKTLITMTGSEPLLAEAASQLMHDNLASPVQHLACISDSDPYCIEHGRRGELVAALLVMQARDAASTVTGRRWVPVSDFMRALFPRSIYETLQRSMPTFWREGEDKPFGETFEDYALWFNHVIRIEDSKMIDSKFLWMFVMRGAMIMTRNNPYNINIVLPACRTKGSLSRDNVTAILIQVKNVERFGDYIESSFDEMDPLLVGLFSDEKEQEPIIRMVLDFGSTAYGVLFPSAREHASDHPTSDRFTSFDIWCAGLSEGTYKDVEDDLASYQSLLRHSRRPYWHGAFDSETDVGHDPDVRDMREFARGRMLPLAGSGPGHYATYV